MSYDESESLSCGINHGLLIFICIDDKMMGRSGIMHIDGVVCVENDDQVIIVFLLKQQYTIQLSNTKTISARCVPS